MRLASLALAGALSFGLAAPTVVFTAPAAQAQHLPDIRACGTMRLWSSGTCVGVLQTTLNRTMVSPYTPLVMDGQFGRKTDSAVRSFQYRYGLTVDGVVGPRTRETLYAASHGA
jgi:peptidoglycan hydrolase-like protein with peptidoglycan-binding domain